MIRASKWLLANLHSSHRSSLFFVAFLLLALAAFPSRSLAQNGTILGTVLDPSGSVIPNVTISITNADTGRVVTIPTNDDGQYLVPDLPVGHYTVTASVAGFKTADRQGVALNVGDRARVDFQMSMGAKTETISVEANPIAVQTDTGEQSTLVSSKQITELATNGRTIYTYIALTPGAANLMPDGQSPTPVGGSGNLSFNGNRQGHNLYLLDGGENSDRGGAGNSSIMPSIDAVAETQVLTSNYSADYGLSSGGTISTVVKSGSQTLHASAWEFFRNDALDARGFFNPATNADGTHNAVAKLRYDIYGFNVGGPVTLGHLYNPEKKKTFFFYNMEWRKITQGTNINQQVPVVDTYGGDFTGNLPADKKLSDKVTVVPNSGLHVPCQNQLSSAQVTAFQAAGITTFSTPGADGDCAVHPDESLASQPKYVTFPGNTLGPLTAGLGQLVSPFAHSLLTLGGTYGGIFPAPNNGNHFQLPVNVPLDVREEIVRIDHNFSDKFNIYGHFVAEQISQSFATSMWSGDNVPSVGNSFGNPSYAGVIHTAYSISPTLVNEVSFNYNGNRINILPAGLISAPAGSYNRFFNVSGQNADNRIPSVNLSGATGSNYTVNWMPWTNIADDYQIRDDVSWTRGRHQIKMGGSWALYKKIQDWFKNTQGNYTFDGSFTGNDFADYLLGYAQDYSEDAFKSKGHWNNVSWALYVQDNWRVNNRLTLNLGLRWDGIPHTYEASNQMANFYPNLYDSTIPAILQAGGNTIDPSSPGLINSTTFGQQFYTNGIAQCGLGGVPKGCVNNSWKNIQPRLGFAYDLFGNGKTIIRGGYGIMNERIQGNDVYNNAGTVPLAASIDFKNVILSTPGTGVSGPPAAGIPVNNVTGMDKPNYASPRSSQFSLGVQHSIGKSVLSVAYVGTQNRHQNFYQEVNLAPLGDIPVFLTNANCAAITTYCPVVGQKPVYNLDVAYPGYHGIRLARNEANGDYNALQTSFRGGILGNDLQYQLIYTYSHTNDAGSNGNSAGDLGNLSNPYAGWKYDFGPANYDIHHTFVANFVYELPFLRHSDNKLARTVVGGWEVSGIVSVQSGAPINLGLNGNSASSIIPNSQNRPDQTGSGHDPHTVAEWFDTSIYSTPVCATGPDCFGNSKRNSIFGPGRDNWNLSLFKNFVLNEARGSNIQFRAEFFNVWNHTQLNASAQNGGVSNNLGASDFGQIKSAYDPRILQLALKLYF